MEELVTKALAANVIDQDFAEDLRGSADLEEALGMFYTHVIEKGDDPEALLTEWGITEPNNAPGGKQMTNRQLFAEMKSTDVTYDALQGELQDGEVLVATWLRDPANFPQVRLVGDENDHSSIVGKTVHGYYVKLRWFASTTGSVNPIDYGMFDKS